MTCDPLTSLSVRVIEHENSDEITIEWDETHPLSVKLHLDEWTSDEWLKALGGAFEEAMRLADGGASNAG
mgnify:CR=1 FL=1